MFSSERLSEVESHTGGAPPDDDRTLVVVTVGYRAGGDPPGTLRSERVLKAGMLEVEADRPLAEELARRADVSSVAAIPAIGGGPEPRSRGRA